MKATSTQTVERRLRRLVKVSALTSIALTLTAVTLSCTTFKHKQLGGVLAESTSKFFEANTVSRFKLSNGLTLLVMEDHSAPTFAYHTFFRVGSKDEQVGHTGLAHLFEHMMFRGTKNNPPGTFDRLLEEAGVEGENAFTSQDMTAYVQSLPATPDRLELIARLEADRMVNLVVDDAALDKEREVVQNERRFRYENNPDGLLIQKIYAEMFKKHPYHWPVIGYAEDLENTKAKECYEFYTRYYTPNNATIVVVGDVRPDAVLAVVKKYYSALPHKEVPREAMPAEPKQSKEIITTVPIKSSLSKVLVAYRVPPISNAQFPRIEVARNILSVGKSSKLYRALVDSGIASAVESYTGEEAHEGVIVFFINLQKGKSIQTALKAFDREIAELINGNISENELLAAKNQHRFSVLNGLATNHKKAEFIGYYETLTGTFETGIAHVQNLSTVTKDEIQETMKPIFHKSNRVVVMGKIQKNTSAKQ